MSQLVHIWCPSLQNIMWIHNMWENMKKIKVYQDSNPFVLTILRLICSLNYRFSLKDGVNINSIHHSISITSLWITFVMRYFLNVILQTFSPPITSWPSWSSFSFSHQGSSRCHTFNLWRWHNPQCWTSLRRRRLWTCSPNNMTNFWRI